MNQITRILTVYFLILTSNNSFANLEEFLISPSKGFSSFFQKEIIFYTYRDKESLFGQKIETKNYKIIFEKNPGDKISYIILELGVDKDSGEKITGVLHSEYDESISSFKALFKAIFSSVYLGRSKEFYHLNYNYLSEMKQQIDSKLNFSNELILRKTEAQEFYKTKNIKEGLNETIKKDLILFSDYFRIKVDKSRSSSKSEKKESVYLSEFQKAQKQIKMGEFQLSVDAETLDLAQVVFNDYKIYLDQPELQLGNFEYSKKIAFKSVENSVDLRVSSIRDFKKSKTNINNMYQTYIKNGINKINFADIIL